MQALDQKVAENGLGHDEILDFFRLLPTSDVSANKAMFVSWVESLQLAGAEIDNQWVDRAIHDLDRHTRLTHEFVIGADHAEYTSLDPKHTKETHFAS